MYTGLQFVIDCTKEACSGHRRYWTWLGFLSLFIVAGLFNYVEQLQYGLVRTGMGDQVSWGVYIANFTFLVGMAAAAVMVVIPSYIFHDKHAKSVVLLAEGVAVAACTMALLFVIVDIGRPDRFWHMLPIVGRFNWPISMLAWDVVVLNGYLGLNFLIPCYFLYKQYCGEAPDYKKLFPVIILAIFWAIALHTVTAFLFSANTGRPFWHTALLGPRFLASAFAAGPAAIILALRILEKTTDFVLDRVVTRMLAVIATVALQVNLVMLVAELFNELYSPTTHSASAQYLFLGLHGHHALVPWIWTAISMEIIAVTILMFERLRQHEIILPVVCAMMIVGIWIEKGMGLIIPGFIPTPLGEISEYHPTSIEIWVSIGIWAIGLLIFTVLAKVAIAIQKGRVTLSTTNRLKRT